MTTIKLSKDLQNPRGVYSIPVTPFKDNGELDIKSLKSCIEFCLDKGAHGIVMPVNASEVATLTDNERDQVLKEGINTVSGSVHFVAGVTGSSVEQVIERAKISGFKGLVLGENVSETYEGEYDVLNVWFKSKIGREVILEPKATHLGLSWYQDSTGKVWWVQMIGNS